MTKKSFIFSLFLLIVLTISACGSENSMDSEDAEEENTTVTVSGKNWTEQIILVYLLGHMIEENTDHDVEYKEGLGSSDVLVKGAQDGDVDLFVDYSGTGYVNILGNEVTEADTQESIFEYTKTSYEDEFGLTWLETLGFTNTWTLIVRQETAEELNLQTFSDLVEHSSDMVLGSDAQFGERKDGLDGLQELYDMDFSDHKEMDISLAYEALAEKQVDILVGYTTDGKIPALNLTTLEDDKEYFPPYYASPIIREDVIENYPDIEDAINKLANQIDEKTMSEMNEEVDAKNANPEEVALNFLKENEFISE